MRELVIYDLDTDTKKKIKNVNCESIIFSPNNQHFIIHHNRMLEIYDIKTHKKIQVINSEPGYKITCISYSDDNEYIFIGEVDDLSFIIILLD